MDWLWRRLLKLIRGEGGRMAQAERHARGAGPVEEGMRRLGPRREGLRLPPIAL